MHFKKVIRNYLSNSEVFENDKRILLSFIERMNKEVEENFYEKRREGENDDYLCELIRNNKIKEFVTLVEQTNLSLENEIKKINF